MLEVIRYPAESIKGRGMSINTPWAPHDLLGWTYKNAESRVHKDICCPLVVPAEPRENFSR